MTEPTPIQVSDARLREILAGDLSDERIAKFLNTLCLAIRSSGSKVAPNENSCEVIEEAARRLLLRSAQTSPAVEGVYDDTDPVMAGLQRLSEDGDATDQQRSVARAAAAEILKLRPTEPAAHSLQGTEWADMLQRGQETLTNAQATGPNPTSQRALEYRLGELLNKLAASPSPPSVSSEPAAWLFDMRTTFTVNAEGERIWNWKPVVFTRCPPRGDDAVRNVRPLYAIPAVTDEKEGGAA